MCTKDQLTFAADTLDTSPEVLDALNLHQLAVALHTGTVTSEEARNRFRRRQLAHLNLSTPKAVSGGLGYSDAGYSILQHASVTHGAVTGTLETCFQVGDQTEQTTTLTVEDLDENFNDQQTVRDTIRVLTDLLDCWDALTPRNIS